MKSLDELRVIREKMQGQVAFRSEHEGEFPILDGFRKHVLVCGGTGCTSSGSKKILEALEREIKKNGLENEIGIVKTGCHRFWSHCHCMLHCAGFHCRRKANSLCYMKTRTTIYHQCTLSRADSR